LQSSADSECETEDGLICHGELGLWREKNGEAMDAVLVHGNILRSGETEIGESNAAYTGIIKNCDFKNFELKIAPAPDNIWALTGKHALIHNDAGNSASYLIKDARSVEGGCILTLDLDPRIGEGFVSDCEDGCVISGTNLRLARFSYYAGKTLANEDQSAMYRLSDVEKGVRCLIHEEDGNGAAADVLSDQFSDRDGDGLSRFIIYDYGPGDTVTIKNIAILQ